MAGQKILIMGADGMLGHKVFQRLHGRFDVYATFRGLDGLWSYHPLFAGIDGSRFIRDIDALDAERVEQVLRQINPDAVINCIGIVKQRDEAKAAIPSILVNALFPHLLADMCGNIGARLIHLSTDCVFSGLKGNYSESDIPDPADLYGRTKLLGELDRQGCLTLRTSIIGWELKNQTSLLEWFALQRGRHIKGFRHAIYTGLSTSVLSDLIGWLLETRPDLSGIYQVASSPITKYDLLQCMREALDWNDITIESDDEFHCDRSLVGSHFSGITGCRAPAWETMIEGLASEWPIYEQWRRSTL